ncbi:nitrate reductase molybdenum cofactor assembly chaperone [Cellulomonas chengniuliangii]|uniref:nitrate reductase molybdenum cofactor assembly chaperone n=1 Tax=Cellulomonas chengniuliangii TaxID=2968084 RepID=UPI001D0E2032|nr:nitrate reductase molybdenum cofactor assembly chaperone [Cellulomonas chengniuliangii]MCC2317220.1 nitrate reductase molybdenum cofactor assembly chaperone [Cellulomonas chengniuliangii]
MSRAPGRLRRGPGRRSGADDGQRALAHRLAALLLDYPDDELLRRLPAVRAAAATLPEVVRDHLLGVVDHLAATPPQEAGAGYVETFDLRRRACLYLTYYAHGDTRQRGVALLAFKQAYRAAGLLLREDELPDHLCVVLEFSATQDLAAGTALLLEHRAGLEVLRLALQDAGSPYAGAVAAVCATLPPLAGDDRDAVARLVAQGPPDESVGLEPYGLHDPALRAPTTLPMPDPSFPGPPREGARR